MVYKLTMVLALLIMLAGCGVQMETIQQLSNDGQTITDELVISDPNEQQGTTQQIMEDEQNIADVLVISDPNEQQGTTQQISEDEQNIADALVISDPNEQQGTTQQISEDEQNIADALVIIAHNMFNKEGSIEYPILSLIEGSVIEVSYVHGYIWRWSGHYNEELVAIAPEGITCFLRPTEISWDGYVYWVFIIGKKDDNTYYDHVYAWYPESYSIEKCVRSSFPDQPLIDVIRTFDLYIPPR